MAKQNIFDVILKTINDVQAKNRANPREETADSSVFDLLKEKLLVLDQKSKAKRVQRGKSPSSILDLIKKEIEGARRQNKRDPNVKTAPGSVFDNILWKVDERPKRQASNGIRQIVTDYNLDVSRLPQQVIQQLQHNYIKDRRNFDQQYAKMIGDLIRRY